MRRRPTLVRTAWVSAFVLVVATITAACGGSSGSNTATRTVKIEMRDIAFSPDRVSVKAGESVRFEFHNAGKVDHEAFVGGVKAQMNHDTQMKGGGMHHGGDSNVVTVAPGKDATLGYTFKAGDNFQIGCHEPGHYAAGMKLAIDVTP